MRQPFLLLIFICAVAQGQTKAPPAESTAQAIESDEPFLKQYPALEKLTYKEPPSGLFLGVGMAPLNLIGSKFAIGLSAFQLHYMSKRIDWEVLNGSFQFAFGSDPAARSSHFVLRSAPKWRINSIFSVGPLLGYEVVSFSNVKVVIQNNGKATPSEPFSSRGFIYGLQISETFQLSDTSYIKLNQVAYQETYSSTKTADNWTYSFDEPKHQELVKASLVVGLEVSYLF